ncbi:hypothetical protein [Sinorhizobium meliloti]|uniref:hypothetical protein n=1 Tax=Rhizobium meliloti TaxID=382 RepID=UPI000FD2AF4A|nr:hypothetical protein [Sinorhizobium meliloti]RVJ89048.1 hypothetical protein CN173_25860 [Sinorhizobium meliloti]
MGGKEKMKQLIWDCQKDIAADRPRVRPELDEVVHKDPGDESRHSRDRPYDSCHQRRSAGR